MTYPPQQPGPYDPEGTGYPQSGGFGQQPGGYQTPGSYPGTGGFQQPGTGGFQQPGTGGFQQPGYQPTAGFQQPGYGGYPGGSFPPPQKKSALPWILTGGGVLVVGVVVVLLFVFGVFGGSKANTGTAQSVAQAYVTAWNNKDSATMNSLYCAGTQPTATPGATGVVPTNASIPNVDVTVALDGAPVVSGTTATAKARVTINGSTSDWTAKLQENNGSWCIDGFPSPDSGTLGSGGSGASSSDSSADNGSSSDDSSGDSSSDNNGGGNSADFSGVVAGDCLSGDASDVNTLAPTDCSNSNASFKVLGVIPDASKSTYDQSDGGCGNYPDTDKIFWNGETEDLGTIFCLQEID